ncbi:MAG TPA: C4-dicarboxylate ABC transporter substrate-binding protein [Syntrophus sp. (in: bacteria)]|nr:C4-dicarboxylate ABC transporter substrate-binding protein [Syntrophus sp. (in: bacteria)]
MKKGARITCVVMTAVILLLSGTARATTFRLVIGAGHPVDAAVWVTSMRDFFQVEIKKRVEATTPHKIEWVEAYGGSIAKLGEVLEAVESGLMDVGDLQVPFEPTKLMAHNFPYFVPFGTPDTVMASKAARKVIDDTPQLRQVLEKKYNQVYLATGTVNSYSLVTTFPWEKVEQLKGKKIAAAGPNIPWLQAVGAIPVQSNLNEAYTSMQTGVYQGWVMFPDGVVGFKLHEVAKYYTFTDFGAISTVMITINQNTWKKLPKEVQAIFLDVGRQYHLVQAPLGVAKSERSVKTMKDTGCTVRTLTWEERVKWANALPNIPQERIAEINKTGMPGNVVSAYYKNLKADGQKFPREWFK